MTQNKNGFALKIAVTGGIGSGKSTVCNIIKEAGYPVFSCDEIYKAIQTDPSFLHTMTEAFGDVVKDGSLDREKISDLVFSDRSMLKKLNAITHPLIMERLYGHMEKYPVAFAEVPLLFEEGRQDDFDGVIVVMRKKAERISSVIDRDNTTAEKIENRIKNQINYEKIDLSAHTVIYNDGDLPSLKQKVLQAIEKIIH